VIRDLSRKPQLEDYLSYNELSFVDSAPLPSENVSEAMMIEAARRFLADTDPRLKKVFDLLESGAGSTAEIAQELNVSLPMASQLRYELRRALSRWSDWTDSPSAARRGRGSPHKS
jgi:DNA-directed RNA polymerase specialized sigma24 family protein